MATKPIDHPPEIIAEQMALDREQRRNERQALVAMPAQDLATAPQRTSFLPQSMGEALQFASIMARSNFVPAKLRGNEGDCMAIVMQAARWGMDPFAVANKAYFVKDGAPPAFESQLVNAVVNSSGALSGRLRIEFDGEGEKLRCTVSGYLRADPNDEKVKTQHIARITTRNSPLWKSDPQQQLAYYTTRAWARLHCPEVLMGVYTPDELPEPEQAKNVTPSAMPRRGTPELSQAEIDAARHIDAQAAGADPATGEVPRDQDNGGDSDGQEQAEPDVRRAMADSLIERIERAATAGAAINLAGTSSPDWPEDLQAEVMKAKDDRVAQLKAAAQ